MKKTPPPPDDSSKRDGDSLTSSSSHSWRPFVTRVLATVASRAMLARGQTVLVAYSAGPDSTALLHVLWRLRERLLCSVLACHIHHGLRGEAADEDARHAEEFAAALGVPFILKRADVRGYATAHRLSVETAARRLRYHLLESTADEVSATHIATGHTASDQAETVLFNIIRGTGPVGLSGIPPVRGRVIRPLYDVTREEVEAYCRAEGLTYREDESNLDLGITRNRMRHEVIPLLRSLQPEVGGALARLAEIMRGENEYISSQVDWLVTTTVHRHDEAVALSLDAFAASPVALQRRLLRRAIGQLKGDEMDLELERIDAVLSLSQPGKTGSTVELPGGMWAERTYDEIVIHRSPMGPAPTGEWELAVPGRVTVPELEMELEATVSEDRSVSDDPEAAVLDADAVSTRLTVRMWRPGDRFTPLGMHAPLKVQDFFVNAHVPRAERHRIPVVESAGRIVWIVGLRIDEESKVTDRTRRTIRLSYRRVHRP